MQQVDTRRPEIGLSMSVNNVNMGNREEETVDEQVNKSPRGDELVE